MRTGRESKELRMPELLLFASADIFGGGGQSILSVLYLVFLTNVLAIHPAWAGAVIMIAGRRWPGQCARRVVSASMPVSPCGRR